LKEGNSLTSSLRLREDDEMFLKILTAMTVEISEYSNEPESIESMLMSLRDSLDTLDPILTLDPFDLFVRVAIGAKFESRKDVEYLCRMCYGISIVRCISSLAISFIDVDVESRDVGSRNGKNEFGKRTRPDDTEDESDRSFIDMVLVYHGLSEESRRLFLATISMETILAACDKVCLPFLKRVCIFVLARFSVCLVEDGDDNSIEDVCGKLDLPIPSIMLDGREIELPIRAWCGQINRLYRSSKRAKLDSTRQVASGPVIQFDIPISANRIALPLRFDELFGMICN
jgi:hypothetical protein